MVSKELIRPVFIFSSIRNEERIIGYLSLDLAGRRLFKSYYFVKRIFFGVHPMEELIRKQQAFHQEIFGSDP